MSIQQETAEKSVQTHDSSISNVSSLNTHPENTAAEVANTLVSMATGRQNINNIINVTHNPSSTILPVSTVEQYTVTNGIPSSFTLETRKQMTIVHSADENDMSNDEYLSTSNQSNEPTKQRRTKTNKTQTSSKAQKQSAHESIQYGPILVKPRKRTAPTLANGRRSKDDPLPPDEEMKRKQRRDRNKHAAAKCRRKRNELREELEKTEKMLVEQEQNLQQAVQTLTEQKNHLEFLLHCHTCARKTTLPLSTNTNHHLTKTDLKTIPNATTILDSGNNTINTKRITINFSNPQDFLAVAPVTRLTTNSDGSTSTVPMITIHILPEGAQALFASTTVDRSKIVELLQQANVNNSNSSNTTIMMNNVPTESIIPMNTSTNSTS